MAISIQDLQSAMTELRQEFQTSLLSLRSETENAVGTALTEIRQENKNSEQRISQSTADALSSASQGFSSEQTRVNDLLEKGTQQAGVLEKLNSDVQAAIEKVAAVSDGKLDLVVGELESIRVDNKTKTDTIYDIFKKEVSQMYSTMQDRLQEGVRRMDDFEQRVRVEFQGQRPAETSGFQASSSSAHGGARGYQIRIPDPKAWNLSEERRERLPALEKGI